MKGRLFTELLYRIMSKSTQFTPQQLAIMGLEPDGNGGYRIKREENNTITAPQIKGKPHPPISSVKEELIFLPDQPTELIKLVILGEPKAQKRHRHFKGKNMSFAAVYDPSKADKKDFLSIVQANAPEKPFDRPLHLEIGFYFGRPKSHFRTGKNSGIVKDSAPEWHTGRPDVDNLFKFCTDALTKVYWRDDSLICSTSITKKYDDNPRTEITITPI